MEGEGASACEAMKYPLENTNTCDRMLNRRTTVEQVDVFLGYRWQTN